MDRGPTSEEVTWLLAVHGRHATWVKNTEASPEVRIKLRDHWRHATASLVPFDAGIVRRFSRYTRLGPRTVGIDPALVRLDFADPTP